MILLQNPTKPISNLSMFSKPSKKPNPILSCLFCTTSTPYPLQYDMIINCPTRSSLTKPRVTRPNNSEDNPRSDDPEAEIDKDPTFGLRVDRKLTAEDGIDKGKRKYYNKRRKRMYGSDSDDDESGKKDEGFVELKGEVVDFHRLHKREEELYFYDTFADPWEKDEHYKMVHQLEKKYFPNQGLDKAFLQPGDVNADANGKGKVMKKKRVSASEGEDNDGKKLVFFEESSNENGGDFAKDNKAEDVTEKKVSDFFKCLKKVPNKDGEVSSGEPYLVTRSSELPPTWDGPYGTVVLVNKPKGADQY